MNVTDTSILAFEFLFDPKKADLSTWWKDGAGNHPALKRIRQSNPHFSPQQKKVAFSLI
jgi:hypothetical protein